MWRKPFHIFVIVTLMLFALLHVVQCGPVPKVNEQQQILMPKVPQWHCLRYFKHDLLMMRRCRHVHVPTAPRLDVEGQGVNVVHK